MADQFAGPLVVASCHVSAQLHIQAAAFRGGVADWQSQCGQLTVAEGESYLDAFGAEHFSEHGARGDELAEVDPCVYDAAREGQRYAGALQIQARLFEVGQRRFARGTRLRHLRFLEGKVRRVGVVAQLLARDIRVRQRLLNRYFGLGHCGLSLAQSQLVVGVLDYQQRLAGSDHTPFDKLG